MELLGTIYHLDNTSCRKRIAHLAEILEIGDLPDQPVRKLSLGQRIRCEIAGSLIHSPSIVFLDEPSIGLDIIAKQKLRGFIRRINREEGVTVFLTRSLSDLGLRGLVASFACCSPMRPGLVASFACCSPMRPGLVASFACCSPMRPGLVASFACCSPMRPGRFLLFSPAASSGFPHSALFGRAENCVKSGKLR